MNSRDIDRNIAAVEQAIRDFGEYLTHAVDVLEDLRQEFIKARKRERYQLRYRRRGMGKKKKRVR